MCLPVPRARMGSIFVQLLDRAPTGNWARGGQVAGKRPYLRSGRSVVRTIIAIRKLDGNIVLGDKRVRRLNRRDNKLGLYRQCVGAGALPCSTAFLAPTHCRYSPNLLSTVIGKRWRPGRFYRATNWRTGDGITCGP